MSTDHRRKITVLVTGVGAIIGQGIIRSLRKSHHRVRVLGIDRSQCSPGSRLCDAFIQKPACEENHPDYLAFWLTTTREQHVDLVLPGLEVDVAFLSQHRASFESQGTVLALNRHELIELSSDKWLLGEVLRRHDLPLIPSMLPSNWDDAIRELGMPPLLFKPRTGNGSRGIVRLDSEEDFNYWSHRAGKNAMLQRIVGNDDEEFTVGVFGLADGTAVKPIVFRRRLSAAGNTQKAEVVDDSTIEEASMELSALFRPIGPTNYQFRKEAGIAYLLEINPRFSSSNSLRTAFGYNEADMAIEYFLLNQRPRVPRILSGTAWRYNEDFVIHDCDSV
ncbi:MAG: ATP-grasp domain-containing protein [Dokdonella sp.]